MERRDPKWAGKLIVTTVAAACAACGGQNQNAHVTDSTTAVEVAKPTERGAAGDVDLRVMLAELASAKACEMIRGQFRPLHAVDKPDTVTGMMWIRECKVTSVGTKVTFNLSGNGWQWADQQQKKAGGTFGIQQYVKFAMAATIPGALDVAYDRADHIVSLWFFSNHQSLLGSVAVWFGTRAERKNGSSRSRRDETRSDRARHQRADGFRPADRRSRWLHSQCRGSEWSSARRPGL